MALCPCGGHNSWFDRSVCPEPCGAMHTCCTKCGRSLDPCLLDAPSRDQAVRVIEDFVTNASLAKRKWSAQEVVDRLDEYGLLRE